MFSFSHFTNLFLLRQFNMFMLIILTTFLAIQPLCPAQNTDSETTQENNKTAKSKFKLIEGLISRQFYQLAEKEANQFIEKYPNHELTPKATYRLGEALRAQKAYKETVTLCERFKQKWPKHDLTSNVLFLKAMSQLALKENMKAAKTLKKTIHMQKKVPFFEAALYYMGKAYQREGKLNDALKAYSQLSNKEINQNYPYRAYAISNAAGILLKQEETNEANKLYKKLSDSTATPKTLKEGARFRLAENLFSGGQYEAALNETEAFIVDHPNSPHLQRLQKIRCLAYLSSGNPQKALSLATTWLNEYPDAPSDDMQYARGVALMQTDHLEKAMEVFAAITPEELPEAPARTVTLASFNHLICLFELNQNKKLIPLSRKLIERAPDFDKIATVRFFLAKALMTTQDYKEAIKAFETVLAETSDNWKYANPSQLLLAECHEQLKHHSQAASVFRQLASVKNIPERANLLLKAARASALAKEYKKAEMDYKKLLKTHGHTTEQAHKAVLSLVNIYNSQPEKKQEAVNLLQELVHTSQPNPAHSGEYRLLLGFLLYKNQDYEKSITVLSPILENNRVPSSSKAEARYFLSAALLRLDQRNKALKTFAPLMQVKLANRPDFNPKLLFKLASLFYKQKETGVSKSIYNWLLTNKQLPIQQKASLRLAEILIQENKLDEGKELLGKLIPGKETLEATASDYPYSPQAHSLLGEIYLKQDQPGRAAAAFERCLSAKGVALHNIIRSQWGMAKLLLDEGKLARARDYAINAFVLGNNPHYTPRAMELAIRIFLKQDNPDPEAARTTWQELVERYPAHANSLENTPVIQSLLETPSKEEKATETTEANTTQP